MLQATAAYVGYAWGMRAARNPDEPLDTIVPHESLGADCCGCIVPVARGDQADLIRSPCGQSSDLHNAAHAQLEFSPGRIARRLVRSQSVSVKTYSCCASRTTRLRLPLRSALTNAKPSRVGSIVTKEIVPSSFLRDATVLCHPSK